MQSGVKIDIEIKKLNEHFSVYKDTQIIGAKKYVFYGLCFNEEAEKFKELLIYPEEGSKYKIVEKGLVINRFEELDMKEYFEQDIDLTDYSFIKKYDEDYFEFKE